MIILIIMMNIDTNQYIIWTSISKLFACTHMHIFNDDIID